MCVWGGGISGTDSPGAERYHLSFPSAPVDQWHTHNRFHTVYQTHARKHLWRQSGTYSNFCPPLWMIINRVNGRLVLSVRRGHQSCLIKLPRPQRIRTFDKICIATASQYMSSGKHLKTPVGSFPKFGKSTKVSFRYLSALSDVGDCGLRLLCSPVPVQSACHFQADWTVLSQQQCRPVLSPSCCHAAAACNMTPCRDAVYSGLLFGPTQTHKTLWVQSTEGVYGARTRRTCSLITVFSLLLFNLKTRTPPPAHSRPRTHPAE